MKINTRSYKHNMSRLFFWLLLSLLSQNIYAASPVPTTIKHAWIRLTPGDGPMAGYFEIVNHTDHNLTLSGANSPAFGSIMIHQSEIHHGEASMHAITQGLAISAGGTLRFSPGGYHLMLMERKQSFTVGEQITITLMFRHHPDIHASFELKPIWFEEERK